MAREFHRARLLCGTAKSENGVQAAESERIRKRSLDLRGTRFVWHDIEVAGGITLNKIRGWRDEISVDGKDRGRRFQGSGRAECVTVHGFGGTNGKAVRVRPKDLAEGARFRGIVRRRSGAVSIHVSDLLAGKPGIVECTTHCSSSAVR
jgi:hypothetical protein